MSPAWKNFLVNGATTLVSILLTYLIGSFVVFRLLLPHLSLNVRPHFPELPEVLVQTTKAGYLPRDYIALLGDSNAEGLGDWLLAAEGNRGKKYGSVHVLHENTGRDVITLGKAGAGSAEAMVRMPARVLRAENCFFFPHLEAPRQMIVYFYEANDLNDNLRFATRAMKRFAGDQRSGIARRIEEDYGAASVWRCYGYLAETTYRMVAFVVTGRDRDVRHVFVIPSEHNKVVIAGTPTPVSVLQEPPVYLNAKETEAAFAVFDLSLAWLRRRFPESATTMVYLPSPAAAYRHADDKVQGAHGWYSAAQIYERSQNTCEEIRRLSLAQGARFIDMRPHFRAAAAKQLIHGPRDWFHFNETGYRVLGDVLARTLDDPASTACRDWDDAAEASPVVGRQN